MGKRTTGETIDIALERLAMYCLQQDAMKFFNLLGICQGGCLGGRGDDGLFPWVYDNDFGFTLYQPSFAMKIMTISNTAPDYAQVEKALEELNSMPEYIRKLVMVFVTDVGGNEKCDEKIAPSLHAANEKSPNTLILYGILDEVLAQVYDLYDPEWKCKDDVHAELKRFVKKHTKRDVGYYCNLAKTMDPTTKGFLTIA